MPYDPGIEPVDAHVRGRDYLTEQEVRQLLAATASSKHEIRDKCLITLMFRHGLRVSEARNLRWTDIDLQNRSMWVNRLKNGLSTTHPLPADSYQSLTALLELRSELPWVFVSERRRQLSRKTVWALLQQLGRAAQLPIAVHPHTLRHACGHELANRGTALRVMQDYLGHKTPSMTVHYTRTAQHRFKDLW